MEDVRLAFRPGASARRPARFRLADRSGSAASAVAPFSGDAARPPGPAARRQSRPVSSRVLPREVLQVTGPRAGRLAAGRAEDGIPQSAAARHALARLGDREFFMARPPFSRGRRGPRGEGRPRGRGPTAAVADPDRRLRHLVRLHPRRTGRDPPCCLPDAGDDPKTLSSQWPRRTGADGHPAVSRHRYARPMPRKPRSPASDRTAPDRASSLGSLRRLC